MVCIIFQYLCKIAHAPCLLSAQLVFRREKDVASDRIARIRKHFIVSNV
jgi:hypothetical protein